ncbi:MAG: hypothetical protein CML02_09400 [Pseudooceanicola sp.]|nr:hypothetical protein [Pseudooceanicola sp.]
MLKILQLNTCNRGCACTEFRCRGSVTASQRVFDTVLFSLQVAQITDALLFIEGGFLPGQHPGDSLADQGFGAQFVDRRVRQLRNHVLLSCLYCREEIS